MTANSRITPKVSDEHSSRHQDNFAVERTRCARRSPRRWADLGELGLCRSSLQRRRMLRMVDAEIPAAWQRKPRDRAPALLVDGRALHVLLLHLGAERLHVVAH